MQRFHSAIRIFAALAVLAVPIRSYASPLIKKSEGAQQLTFQRLRKLAEYGAPREETDLLDSSTMPVSLSAPEDPDKSEILPDIPIPFVDPDHPSKRQPFLTDEQANKLASDTVSAILGQLNAMKSSPSHGLAEFAADMWEIYNTRDYPFSIYSMEITILLKEIPDVVHKVYTSSAWDSFKASRPPTVASAHSEGKKVVVDVKVKYFTEAE